GVQAVQPTARRHRVRGLLVLLMGCLALAAPFFAGALALFLVGLLLIVCGVLEMLETFYAPDEARRRSSYLGGLLSVRAGILLLARPRLVVRGLALLVAGSFLIDGFGKTVAAWRARAAAAPWGWVLVSGLVNVALGLVLVTGWPVSGLEVVAVV